MLLTPSHPGQDLRLADLEAKSTSDQISGKAKVLSSCKLTWLAEKMDLLKRYSLDFPIFHLSLPDCRYSLIQRGIRLDVHH